MLSQPCPTEDTPPYTHTWIMGLFSVVDVYTFLLSSLGFTSYWGLWAITQGSENFSNFKKTLVEDSLINVQN